MSNSIEVTASACNDDIQVLAANLATIEYARGRSLRDSAAHAAAVHLAREAMARIAQYLESE